MYITLFAILIALFGSIETTEPVLDKNQYSTSSYDPTRCTEECIFDENGGELSHIPPR